MNWWPGDIIDIVSIVLERVERPVLFQAPQLDGPIDGGGEEQVAEVHSTQAVVSAQAGYGCTLVTFKMIQYSWKNGNYK